jgi:hypothetical protein
MAKTKQPNILVIWGDELHRVTTQMDELMQSMQHGHH